MISIKHTPPLTISTVNKTIYCLGLATLAALALAALLFILWLVQETLLAITEIIHLVSVTNPMIITGVLIVLAVYLMGKIKGRNAA